MIKKYGIYIIVLVLIIVASVMIYTKLNPKKLPANLISATGRIDGDLITLNTKYPGRIKNIFVDDGQKIKIDEVIAVIKSDEYKDKIRALNESIKSALHNFKAMQYELDIAKVDIPLNIKKSQKAVEIAKAQKKELLASIKSLISLVVQDTRDFMRNKTLYKNKLLAKQKFEYSQLKLTTDKNRLKTSKAKLIKVDKSIDISKYNHKLSISQENKILALKSNMEATKSKIESLKANRDEVQVMINELTIKSPIDGLVIEKIANKGEVIGAGAIIATLIEPKDLYLKVFIDTINNGKIKIGDDAVIFLDAYPNRAIKAKVVNIAANAEFTPKDVAVRSDRIQRVYAVHLKPLHVEPLLKLGIPAIGVISIDGKGLPSSLSDIPSI